MFVKRPGRFHVCFLKLFTSAILVSYKKTWSHEKDTGLVLVYCNRAAIMFSSSLLYKLAKDLFKIQSTIVSELVLITENYQMNNGVPKFFTR